MKHPPPHAGRKVHYGGPFIRLAILAALLCFVALVAMAAQPAPHGPPAPACTTGEAFVRIDGAGPPGIQVVDHGKQPRNR